MIYWTAEGYLRGQPVNILSDRIKGRKGIKPFTYSSHVRNDATNAEWVDVYDAKGKPWSFKAEQVSLPKPKRKRKTS